MGNGRLATRILTDGAGSIGWNQNALTRVAPGDPEAGHWLYMRDIDGGDVWTATGGPFPQPEEPPQVVFHAHQVEFHRRAHGLSRSEARRVGTEGVSTGRSRWAPET